MRHRAPRRRPRSMAVVVAFLGGLAALVVPFWWPFDPGPPSAPSGIQLAKASPMVQPTSRARPKYLTQSYRAPPALVRSGAGGTLRIPSLNVLAPVDAVGLDGTAMAVPDDSARLGWLTSTARADDVVGASVLAGHVSDRQDRPGALAGLKGIRIGATITWVDAGRRVHRYRVIGLQRFSRLTGLPARLFSTDGPHLLHLITCADRVTGSGGGFHYRSNLVVTARERTHQTRRGSSD